ncbi:RND family efflux transporter, MFP subunit [Porphyromonadaceae bacterium KH3R12]|uniref:efflux RND transporter periplasmic adaptor subunit n=1 Tax=Proteiniphilum sp. TaxID=1926877 RepID=UPI000898707D|nr:efflux RND transporter periplasmic adaptor subunit [Proteiniphilum sp.]MDY9918946.1 efflux RND transporter periplasmic adaptor subunit [Proteiniphilum sp.]OJV75917.1 MAG: efflux transporter periplasmic adaptor subunit [Bacteroidia bacterium 44-10]SDZ90117.1 RND family efflux transporter, MFP subunit [Porphyromonadaceae bacterium KH3R12]
MKYYILGLFLVAATLLFACNSNNKNQKSNPKDTHEHVEGDGHDHSEDDGHVHSPGDGHNHSEDDGHNHSEGDGHDHSKDDGHNHGTETAEHTDEILFTKEQAKSVGLTTETVSPGTFLHVIKTSGQVQATQGDEATIVATSNGIVSFINSSISDGTAISSGQAIVTISARNLLDGDPTAKAKIAFETAQAEFKRAEGLIKDNIISTKEYEQVKLRYETAKTVYEAQAANTTAGGVRVTSPISGYLKNRLVSQGEYVSVGQPIATVSQNKRVQLKAEVSENYFNSLRNISSANFRMAYDKTVYKLSDMNGRLLSFGRAADRQSFYIPVTFEFDNVGDIIPGSFAEVYLLSSPQENIISVPVSALTEEQGLYFVYLQLDEEGYKKQEVIIGQNNGERVEILAGLSSGDKVVTKGVYQVKLAAISSIMPDGHTH